MEWEAAWQQAGAEWEQAWADAVAEWQQAWLDARDAAGGGPVVVLNISTPRADELDMAGHQPGSVSDARTASRDLRAGTILVSSSGAVKVIRSRTADQLGWNCADGAPIHDESVDRPDLWTIYTPEQLVADLELAGELRQIGGQPEMGGGLATWDACSGRPCVLPKLARLVN